MYKYIYIYIYVYIYEYIYTYIYKQRLRGCPLEFGRKVWRTAAGTPSATPLSHPTPAASPNTVTLGQWINARQRTVFQRVSGRSTRGRARGGGEGWRGRGVVRWKDTWVALIQGMGLALRGVGDFSHFGEA